MWPNKRDWIPFVSGDRLGLNNRKEKLKLLQCFFDGDLFRLNFYNQLRFSTLWCQKRPKEWKIIKYKCVSTWEHVGLKRPKECKSKKYKCVSTWEHIGHKRPKECKSKKYKCVSTWEQPKKWNKQGIILSNPLPFWHYRLIKRLHF